jgi:hypothetical protein
MVIPAAVIKDFFTKFRRLVFFLGMIRLLFLEKIGSLNLEKIIQELMSNTEKLISVLTRVSHLRQRL